MIAFPPGVKVWLAGGATDMRQGMNSLALMVRARGSDAIRMAGSCSASAGAGSADQDPLARRGGHVASHVKRLDHGRFLWPTPADGAVAVSAAQLGYLLEGIDWRNPRHTWRPSAAG